MASEKSVCCFCGDPLSFSQGHMKDYMIYCKRCYDRLFGEPDMSIGKVKDVINSEHFGKIITVDTEKMGKIDFLMVRVHNPFWHDFVKFVPFPKCVGLYNWDFLKNDDVLEIKDLKIVSYETVSDVIV